MNENDVWKKYEDGKKKILEDDTVQTFDQYEKRIQELIKKLKL